MEQVHGASVLLESTGAAGHLSIFKIVGSDVIQRDLLDVVLAWNTQKAIYWVMQTTEGEQTRD
ncbi:hypothetical protein FIBSPDRAFT_266508 [Athelia psychrophila]|uniref:Uncharacterized protein n=1 Tax=Athelia psychrophila TaxID=1759441 RepID=A0A165X4Q5_9AGAM|nr:hypothetical protein FIBSPDRAFT_266508 [Fibularhizoctonia sp. CBS 109695]